MSVSPIIPSFSLRLLAVLRQGTEDIRGVHEKYNKEVPMSRAEEIIKVVEQDAKEQQAPNAGDLKAVLDELDYGLSTELDHNAQNLSTGTEATTIFELSNDQGPNWLEFQLWDKNRFDKPLGSIRYVCGMKANADSISLSSGKGIENVKFNSKDEDIEKIPDLQGKDDYKDKINRIRTILMGFQMNVTGVTGIPNSPDSFENIGRRMGRGLLKKCAPYMK